MSLAGRIVSVTVLERYVSRQRLLDDDAGHLRIGVELLDRATQLLRGRLPRKLDHPAGHADGPRRAQDLLDVDARRALAADHHRGEHGAEAVSTPEGAQLAPNVARASRPQAAARRGPWRDVVLPTCRWFPFVPPTRRSGPSPRSRGLGLAQPAVANDLVHRRQHPVDVTQQIVELALSLCRRSPRHQPSAG